MTRNEKLTDRIDTMVSMYALGGFCAEIAEAGLKELVHPLLAKDLLSGTQTYTEPEINAINVIIKKTDRYEIKTEDFYQWLIRIALELRGKDDEYLYFFLGIDSKLEMYDRPIEFTSLEQLILAKSFGLDDGREKKAEEIAKSETFQCPPAYISCILDSVYRDMNNRNLADSYREYAQEYIAEHTKGTQI